MGDTAENSFCFPADMVYSFSMSLPLFIKDTPPKLFRQEIFTVRSYACDEQMRLTLPGLINMLQEIAGLHATSISVGVLDLQKENLTWMLSRMRIHLLTLLPAWGEQLVVTTWPSGVKGRLSAVRDFIVETPAGTVVAEGISEWLMIDLISHRIARLPPSVLELVTEGTPRVSIDEPSFPENTALSGTIEHTVRRSDMDLNRHVNNVHYTEWALESVSDEFLATHTPEMIDITFKNSAVFGNRVLSETFTAADHPGLLRHDVCNAADRSLFAKAFSHWRPL